ncbi:hypothetical protein BC940DRAFT_324126 [Gongronella butleri]|nr:hypothetical protein BC940DRAFT_324126 [Gongronella butleri]
MSQTTSGDKPVNTTTSSGSPPLADTGATHKDQQQQQQQRPSSPPKENPWKHLLCPLSLFLDEETWPAPNQITSEDKKEPKKEKTNSSNGKGKGRAQWKPLTPTITHSTPAPGKDKKPRANKRKTGDNGKKKGDDKAKVAAPPSQAGIKGKPVSPTAKAAQAPASDEAKGTKTAKGGKKTSHSKANGQEHTQRDASNASQQPGPAVSTAGGGSARRKSSKPAIQQDRRRSSYYAPVVPVMYPPYYVMMDVETIKGYILQQIDYYFSIDNLCKDMFLRSKMDTAGFVDLGVLADFNRIKQWTNHVPLLKQALLPSQVVEVQGDLVRKREGWEQWVLPNAPVHEPARRHQGATADATDTHHTGSIEHDVGGRGTGRHPHDTRDAQNTQNAHNDDDDDDVFALDEELSHVTLASANAGDDDNDDGMDDDEDVDEDAIARIMLFTQGRKTGGSNSGSQNAHPRKPSMVSGSWGEHLDVINDGLRQFEAKGAAPRDFESMMRFYPAQPRGVVQSNVGWVFGEQPYHYNDMDVYGSSVGSVGSFVGSFESLPRFQHPSHSLLENRGFVQQKYYKYHARALRERKRLGIGLSHEMNT